MSVTIKDIARIAKVSHTTVSRALNESPLINRETKERIKAIAEELQYIPNINAKSLVLDRSYNLGLFFSTINTGTSPGFFYETVRGVNGVIGDRFNLIVKGIDDYKDYNSITRRSFDGIVLMSQSDKDDAFIRDVTGKGIPLVVLNRQAEGMEAISVLSDDYRGACLIMEYLIGQGHRQIAVIKGKKEFKSTERRMQGYLDTLINHKITVDPEMCAEGDYTLESGYRAMQQLVRRGRRPTAVFCLNDDMAVGAMKAIVEAGLRVADDISVAGFDDNVFSGFVSPGLTTVKRPVEKISRAGSSLLIDIIEKKPVSAEPLFLYAELVLRDSVKPPANK